jgi:hypothetical protein
MEKIFAYDREKKLIEVPFLSIGDYLPSTLHNIRKLGWINGGLSFFLESEENFSFFPIYSLNKIAVVWYGDSRYPPPTNLVIYNVDATVHKLIAAPEILKFKNGIRGKFANFRGLKIIDNYQYLIVNIYTGSNAGRAGDLMELRALDLETGEFHPTWHDNLYW